MLNQYKVTISNNKLYKEIELPVEATMYSVGTTVDSDYRIRKEFFFSDIKLIFMNDGGNWSVMCSDNLYASLDDARKMLNVRLSHGIGFDVKYQDSDNTVFHLDFGVDFDSKVKKYERRIDIKGRNNILIGTANNNNIIIRSEYLFKDCVELIRNGAEFTVKIISLTYGVYVNGNRIYGGENITSGNFLSISDFSFYIKDDSIWTEATDACKVNGLSYMDLTAKNNYPVFSRNTRINLVVDETDIAILDPPTKPSKPKNNLLMTILPSLGMLLAAGVMASMGGAMIIFSLISSGMAIVTGIVGMIQSKRDYKKDCAERIEKYNNYIKKKRYEIEEIRKEELNTLNNIYIDKQSEYERLDNFSSDLFDRSKEDKDYLCVRLGLGAVEAKRKINYKKQEKLEIEDNLQEIPEVICNEYKSIDRAPVICDLKELNALGVIGRDELRFEILKTFIIDLISRHFYSDVKLFFVFENEHEDFLYDIRFLPHIVNKDINTRNVVYDDDSKKIIFEYLYNILSQRESADKKSKENNMWEHFVIFFYDQYGFSSHPISRFVDKAKDLGVTFVFFGNERRDIPMGCNEMINILDDTSAELIKTENELSKLLFTYERVDTARLKKISKYISPIETDEVSLESSLTKNINLFELLNIFGVEDLNLKERWATTEVYNSMSVPLGVSKTGVVYLDLHDKAHGPHGLVAGTTGSGKSEILQTYILSIATYFHPYEVAFLIIDFKGGGMVNQFRDLPHLLGAITNIDGKEIDRSLKSIKAELQKRQRLFAEVDVNHIDLYIRKYKSGEARVPLPHLIIIVDEFAELKAEQPEFMKELISAARIGRSLGVHLILATQKPAGQVDEQIWSNSRFKLCLKVQGPEDSNEVLKSPLAAEIKEPGRAYLQVGNNEIFELFQSAYSGASEKDVDNAVKPFKVCTVDTAGRRNVIFEQKNKTGDDKGNTQLQAVVKYVRKYCDWNGIGDLPSICLEALKSKIDFSETGFEKENPLFDIGIYDDPDNQYQGKTYFDISGKNTFILGSSQYGKTNLLQLIIREIAYKYTPAEANIYILDFGSMVLKTFEKLNHVGGVVCSSDDEKLKNLFKLLLEEIVSRKEKIVSKGLSSFNAYVDSGFTDLPRIYVIVDNMTALMDLYLENDDSLLTIIREGQSFGVLVIMANSQTSGISYKYLANFSNRVAFYCNDTSEYNNIFDHIRDYPSEIPGRCVIEHEKKFLECQTYLSFDGEKEVDRAKSITKFIEEQNEKNKGLRAKQIPIIPDVLTNDYLFEQFGIKFIDYNIPIGMTYMDVEPFSLDLSNIGALGLCGKEKKGHYTFVANLLNTLNDNKVPAKVYIFDDVSRKFKSLSGLDIIKKYTLDASEVESVLKGWKALLEDRYNSMLNETEPFDNELLIMIIQNNDVASYISKQFDLLNLYKDIVSKYKALNVGIIYSNYHNNPVPYDAPEVIRMIKSERHLICFDDLNNLKVFDVNYEDVKANRKKLQLGDAYYIDDNIVTKLKLVKN